MKLSTKKEILQMNKLTEMIRRIVNEETAYSPNTLRTNMPGWVGKDVAKAMSDDDLMQYAKLLDTRTKLRNQLQPIRKQLDTLRKKYNLPPLPVTTADTSSL